MIVDSGGTLVSPKMADINEEVHPPLDEQFLSEE
jgi:hypothetical protein